MQINFNHLDEIEFENYCYDLLSAMGFINIDWRKGTGLKTSPSDRGRDIVCQLEHIDVDMSKQLETWFVECKHFKKGIPPDKLQNLLNWSEAEKPNTALFITSNFLSNSSKDYLNDYIINRKPPFRIKYWELPDIENLSSKKKKLLLKYDLIGNPSRTIREILFMESELCDKVWYNRHHNLKYKIQIGKETVDPIIWKGALESAKKVEDKYGLENLGPWDDFEWGMINGKLSALRWILGEDWDELYT